MMRRRHLQIGLGVLLAVVMVAGSILLTGALRAKNRTTVTAYFDNSNGIFVGDNVVMLGVRIGRIESIEPQPDRAKITFWFDRKYQVPADANAVILSPQLITSRAIQLTPAYTGGAELTDDAVIPQSRTAVPVEWDDFRQQLEKLSSSLQPGPDGLSPMGAFVDVAAQNLRGRGTDIRAAITELSRALSTLGDHSTDIFGTVKNLATLVSGLQSSTALMKELNLNLAGATGLLADHPAQIGAAVEGLNTATQDITSFISTHREALGVTSDKLGSVAQALVDSTDDIKQVLHLAPNTFQNLINIFEPAHSALTGALVMNNFANPIQFLCGAIQAASRLGAEHAAKLCVQYLAPIMKNRQYNFPPIGLNPIVNAAARPNEITYSENWMRPDHRESTNPDAGLPGMMVAAGAGS
ncbi:MCE family protein [Mycolicibacterium diernhoferi]|uniref:Mammalian cell entry protein n=2 Tax=Mycolicibacterium diernhoferi TaxID=1801 RepID=A0A1Q4HI70_9MYCO|nr:MCE family protein [Mycolicibacterium diernhoferi]OJZ67193.1 mammalian cell entry protein [Mycolicibacterium diernhoferi]OPE45461.1 mammalian cell entry protein [Mycolicibacterium diernhoferi]PEG52599.1 mammalian cell entry protein [Mycolicibacterium diernhoferi]QYL23392.1 MCE family protein [Mycolicibacterium diernhoferi]